MSEKKTWRRLARRILVLFVLVVLLAFLVAGVARMKRIGCN